MSNDMDLFSPDEIERKKRDADPEYSLGASRSEFVEAEKALRRYVVETGDPETLLTLISPEEFVREVARLTRELQFHFREVQDELLRVTDAQNPGWDLSSSRIPRFFRNRRYHPISEVVEPDDQ